MGTLFSGWNVKLCFVLVALACCWNYAYVAAENADPTNEEATTKPAPSKEKKAFDLAIKRSDIKGAIAILRKIQKETEGVVDDAMLYSVASLIHSKSWSWGMNKGKERYEMWSPLYGLSLHTKLEYAVAANCSRGLMESGEPGKAMIYWGQSGRRALKKWKEIDFSGGEEDLKEAIKKAQTIEKALRIFAYGFGSSEEQQYRVKGVDLANQLTEMTRKTSQYGLKELKLTDPRINAKLEDILNDHSRRLLNFCVVQAKAKDKTFRTKLIDEEPETSIHFKRLEKTRLPASGLGRIVVADVNNDNFVGVFVPTTGLFLNINGSGKFERSNPFKGEPMRMARSGAIVDVNNDCLPDLVVAFRGKPGSIVVNLQQEDGSFKKLPPQIAVHNPEGFGLFDGDLNGVIDIFLASYEGTSPRDMILRGCGDGTFEDVTEKWGRSGKVLTQAGRGVSPADYDGDGRTDVYVSNYRLDRNMFWHNKGTRDMPKFIESCEAPLFGKESRKVDEDDLDAGVAGMAAMDEGEKYYGHTIGSVWGDIDNNGHLDLVCANLAHPRYITMGFSDITRVYLNDGKKFRDNTIASGIRFSELNSDPLLADFDNDGDLDLSITDVYKASLNHIFQGDGKGGFAEITHRSEGCVFDGWGQAAGDFDNDGDLDWFVGGIRVTERKAFNRSIQLFENTYISNNEIPTNGNFVQIRLRGKHTVNTMAYGAQAKVIAGNKTYLREVAGMRGTSSCDDPVVHVGLGTYKGKVDLEIRWSYSHSSKVSGLEVNRRYSVEEPEPDTE